MLCYIVSCHRCDVLFDCQLGETFTQTFGNTFLGITSVTFSRGSVRVNSVVQLAEPPSDDDQRSISDGVIDTFKRNGFVVDDVSMKRKQGSTNSNLADCQHLICFFL